MVTGKKSYVLDYFNNSVWNIKPQNLKTIAGIITSKIVGNGLVNLIQAEPAELKSDLVQVYHRTGILNIEGVLVPKASWLDSMCGFISTLELNHQFNMLVDSPNIDKIVLYFDSPGGVSTGIYEFAENIYQNRNKKEIVSFTDVDMCSAAFWLGSAASKVIATPSSEIGSIGTYIALIKEKPESMEYDIYFIQAGDNKLYGNPNIPVTESEKQYFQDKVNTNNNLFVEAISKFRNVSKEKVLETKASYYDSLSAPDWMYDTLADTKYILE